MNDPTLVATSSQSRAATHTRATSHPQAPDRGWWSSVTVDPRAKHSAEECKCERDMEPQHRLSCTQTFVHPLTQIFHQHTAAAQLGIQGIPNPHRATCFVNRNPLPGCKLDRRSSCHSQCRWKIFATRACICSQLTPLSAPT